jgi:hypothetical protein
MSEAIVEDLILAIQATGISEATAGMDSLIASTDKLTAATDRASAAFSGEGAAAGRAGAAGSKGKGLVGNLMSLKNLAIVGGLTEFTKHAVTDALKLETTVTSLSKSLSNAHQLGVTSVAKLEEQAKASSTHGGFAMIEELEGINRFVNETKDVTTAVQLQSSAVNLARGAHLGLAQAQQILARGFVGTAGRAQQYLGIIQPIHSHVEALTAAEKKLHPELKSQAELFDKQATAALIASRITQQFGNQQEAFSKTFAGQISDLKNQATILFEDVGMKLIPVLKSLLETGKEVVVWFGRNKDAAYALGLMLGVLATAWAVEKVIAFYRAMKALTIIRLITSLLKGQALATAEAGAAETAMAGETFTLAGALGLMKFGALSVLTPLAQVALAIGAIVAVAEVASRLMGKGSFVNNLKDALGGQSWIGKSEHEFDHIASGHLNALKQLEAARRAHPKTAALMRAHDHGRSPFTGQPIHATPVLHQAGLGSMNLYAHAPVKIDLNGREISRSVVKVGLEGQSGK